jgi:hypothetical protein
MRNLHFKIALQVVIHLVLLSKIKPLTGLRTLTGADQKGKD